MKDAVNDPEVEIVVIGLPNNLHLEAVLLAALQRKPFYAPNRSDVMLKMQKRCLMRRESRCYAWLSGGSGLYAENTESDSIGRRSGAIGQVTWARSRETHPGPHSDWFWTKELFQEEVFCWIWVVIALKFAVIILARIYDRYEVMCWADTLVKPIDAEDNALGWVRYENGAIGQFEVSWTFRGGMDLRDEVMGTDGTIWTK